ncbi:2OG-Fe dioxygenase family protein [Yersinia aleksiciae]|uniref:2OG-Fe dioxygenase family protein n=1 Tax=Yersinia aleksiciae TaxID=263819 RepID=UPI001427DFCB|nr:2OG-Fe dioxygenase family protein [Yersinia aleksiciae]MDA5499041.1 2OG-Fe dioxygenase family protein [Yersinia aleksiciae]NIL00623.1 2OG-Fe dioxygenase family protein [Yersinia aleksiciae]WQC70243.1 2OG-Fe dioxygenase family protein [Yersinia aleksiciae]
MQLKYKIIKFNTDEFGIKTESIKNEMPFELLIWDVNDIKISQLKLLIELYPEDKDVILQEAQHYLDNQLAPKHIQNLISRLSDVARKKFYAYKPFRKRSMSRFIAEHINNQWEVNNIDLLESIGFTQRADHPLDLRQLIRKFPPMALATRHSPILKALIKNFVAIISECEPQKKPTKIEVTCHQMSLLIDGSTPSVCNSPEGLHQDGSDYIVSALVIDKYNIEGGISQLYCAEKKGFIKSHTLELGEGLFHIDKNSTIWHQVTPITLREPSIKIGYRNILGFDFNYIA